MIVHALLVVAVVLFGLLFVAVGLFALYMLGSLVRARWAASAEARRSQRWVATKGRVTRALVSYTTGRRGRIYRATIHFAFRVGDVEHVSEHFAFVEQSGEESDARDLVARHAEGSDVTVYYDPARPERSTLDRRVPSIVGFTIGWSLLMLLLGGFSTAIGVDVIVGAFEHPPPLEPTELPSTSAQLGAVVVCLGTLVLLVAGVRALGSEARRQRRLLGLLASAKPAAAGQVRHGERVVVVGRAEDVPAAADGATAFELPFERGRILFYDIRYGPYSERCVAPFVVRDDTGAVEVWIESVETELGTRASPIRAELERWLQEKYRQEGDSVPSGLAPIRFERIRKGDTVLVVADAEHDEDADEVVLRAREGEPGSLLADAPREELIKRLSKRGRTTRLLCLLGVALAIVGGILMAV